MKAYTEFMEKLWIDENLEEEFFNPPTGFMHFFGPNPEIKNPNRMWFQLWKPKMIPNPDYKNEYVEFYIQRNDQ